jgi:hypothetical protein
MPESRGWLSTPFHKFANVSKRRLLTRAAPIKAAAVRGRSCRSRGAGTIFSKIANLLSNALL